MKMRELFTDESTWTQNATARDSEDKPVYSTDTKAVCWCLNGAAIKCYVECSYEYWEVYAKLRDSVGSVCGYNDAENRTFKDIQELVARLDI